MKHKMRVETKWDGKNHNITCKYILQAKAKIKIHKHIREKEGREQKKTL